MASNFDIIRTFLNDPSNVEDIWESEALVWVDNKDYDEDVVDYFNEQMDYYLEVETQDNKEPYGEDIILKKNNFTFKIPYDQKMTRDDTIKYLNDFIKPEYEIRFFTQSQGSDTLAFAILEEETWDNLEDEFGSQYLNSYFAVINLDSKLFEEI